MAIILTDDKHYKAIADKLRELVDEEATYRPQDMADEIGVANSVGYEDGYADGEEVGYDDGYDLGWEMGSLDGYDFGVNAEYDRFWGAFQQNGDRRNHMYAFAGAAWNGDTFKPKYPIRFNDTSETTRHAMGTFTYFGWGADWVLDLSTIDIDFSGCKTMTNTFANAQVNNVYVDGSNLATMTGTFNRADAADKNCLTDVTLKITDKCYNFTNAFAHCRGLVNLTIEEGSVIGASLDLSAATVITKKSIMSVLKALKDYSGSGKTYTLTLGTTNLAKLTDAEKAIATQKGWSLA